MLNSGRTNTYNDSHLEKQDFTLSAQYKFGIIPIFQDSDKIEFPLVSKAIDVSCDSGESCVVFEDCFEVARNYHNKSKYPQICGRNEATSFICCNNTNAASENFSYTNVKPWNLKNCSKLHGENHVTHSNNSTDLDTLVFDSDAEQDEGEYL